MRSHAINRRRRYSGFVLFMAVGALLAGCGEYPRKPSDATRIANTKRSFKNLLNPQNNLNDTKYLDELAEAGLPGPDRIGIQYLMKNTRHAMAVLESAKVSDFDRPMPVSAHFYETDDGGVQLSVAWLCSDRKVAGVYVEDSEGNTLAKGPMFIMPDPDDPADLGLEYHGYAGLIAGKGGDRVPILKLDLKSLNQELRVGLLQTDPGKKSEPIKAYVNEEVRKMIAAVEAPLPKLDPSAEEKKGTQHDSE